MPVCCKFDYQFLDHREVRSGRTFPRVDVLNSCREFIGRIDEDHTVMFGLLSAYGGSIDEFLSLRRSVWPDSRFYHPKFSPKRMLLAVGIACDLNNLWTAAPICRSVLGLDNGTAQDNMNFQLYADLGDTIFHGLARKVGKTHGTETAREWHNVLRDIVRHLTNITALSRRGFVLALSDRDFVTTTPFTVLIEEALNARLGRHRQQVTIRSTDSAAVLAGCEKSIFAWLSDLYQGGIDLELYGENEMEHFRHQASSRHGGSPLNGMTYSYFHLSWNPPHRNRVYRVRLINFQYGKLPADWKFWWSEPSDEFTGDFWLFVESGNQEAVMAVPGAWVE